MGLWGPMALVLWDLRGFMCLPFIVLIGSGSALLALLFPSFRQMTNDGKLPFGPFLALGIACVWLSMTFASYLG